MTKVAPAGSQPRKETVQIKALKPLGPTRPATAAAPAAGKPASGVLASAPAAGSASSAPTTVVKSPTPPPNKGAAASTPASPSPAPAKMAPQTVVVEGGGADALSVGLAGVAAFGSWAAAIYLALSYFAS